GGGPVSTGDPAADYLRALESGQVGYRLKLEQAVELAVVNGREMQDRREDLYLAALDVTLRRFSFAAQGLFTEQAIRESVGNALNPNFRGSESTRFNTNIGFSKLFSTGALLTTQIANRVVVDLSGDTPTTSVSNLTLSLMQPFLQGGGKAVTLEPLTLSERNLVYAMRSFARFRKLFFVAIAAGPISPLGYTNNPYGLQGLSQNLGRGIGGNLTAPNVGYLPLLQQQAIINNQRKNVAELERLLRIYRAYREGGQLAPLQVDQLEVQLLTSRGQLLGSTGGGASGIRGFLDSLDSFKLQLGLPITVPLELNDAPLRAIYQQLGRLEDVSAQARALDAEAERFDPALAVADFRARWRDLLTASPLVRGTQFGRTVGARWDTWSPARLSADQFDARMSALLAERRKLLDARTDRQVKGVPEPEAEVRRLEALSADIDLGEFERAVRAYEARPWLKKGAATFVPQAAAYRAVYSTFQLLAIEARNERQAIVRGQWPDLPPLDVNGANVLDTPLDEAYALAVQAALTNRLDLMNARAQVVDAWRNIAVTANSLQGVFNVRYDLTSSTPPNGNNPVGFSNDRSTHQLTFNAELPLVRRAERNNYRAALISYQRQRRTLMAFEDNIANDVRSDVRDLRTFGQLYRIQQRVVELGYSQVDNAQLTQFAPLAAGVTLDAAAQAALTQQVLQTQSNLLSAQNTLFQIWVAYQTARMSLYLDLEQMPLDDRGVWCDEFFNRADRQDRTSPDDRPAGERLPAPRPLGDGPGR
ncbi:MAG: TolC family protein, partial [Planctomycetes bacterium]|nr:TolC family protein [Planctomycetota bacterium]